MTKVLSTILFCTFFAIVFSTTEWFGDLRAQYNPLPAGEEPFYDVMYDDTGR